MEPKVGHHTWGVPSLKRRSLLSITDLSHDELLGVLRVAAELKRAFKDEHGDVLREKPLTGRTLAMIFQKRSTRTRVSTETGWALLGGHALFLGPQDIQLGVNETMKDTALVLSRYNSMLLARVYGHDDVVTLAKEASVPVINALSDLHHPLQALADIMTLQEHFGPNLAGKTIAWVGDGNNVLHDLALGATALGMSVRVGTPQGYSPDAGVMDVAEKNAEKHGATLIYTTDPIEAVKGADIVVTDTWISMGQEAEKAKRLDDFAGYQVTRQLMSHANDGAVFLHCLPRKMEEVDDEVFYSPSSLVFDEAENRMWTLMAVSLSLLGK